MSWGNSNGGFDIVQQASGDALRTERKGRERAEQELARYKRVFAQLRVMLHLPETATIDDISRAMTGSFGKPNWDSWELTPASTPSRTDVAAPVQQHMQPTVNVNGGEYALLLQMMRELQQELRINLAQKPINPKTQNPPINPQKPTYNPKNLPQKPKNPPLVLEAEPLTAAVTAVTAENATEQTTALPEIGFALPTHVPERFAKYGAFVDGSNWQMTLAVIGLMAQGRVLRIDIGKMLESKGGSTQRVLERLTQSKLIESEKYTNILQRTDNAGTTIVRLMLTDTGRELCRACGWAVVESDWERLARLHQGQNQIAHSCAVLLAAAYARQRNFGAAVLPPPQQRAEPDLSITKDGQTIFVEVELGEKERAAKWRNQVQLQGFVALVSDNPKTRQRFVDDCKSTGCPGIATDLQTINSDERFRADETLFWAERWGDVPEAIATLPV